MEQMLVWNILQRLLSRTKRMGQQKSWMARFLQAKLYKYRVLVLDVFIRFSTPSDKECRYQSLPGCGTYWDCLHEVQVR